MKDRFKGRMGLKLIAAATAALAALASPNIAKAEPRVDWIKALVELDQLARGKPETPAAGHVHRPRPADDPSPNNMGNAWFGVAPTVSLVARDWASSTRLAGERLAFVDEVRLAASTRMVVGRVRLGTSATRFTPFLQVGVGQWRIDRKYMPLLPHTMEIASQLGTGFEMRVTRRWQLATEVSATSLLRDEGSQTLPQTLLWSALVASRLEF